MIWLGTSDMCSVVETLFLFEGEAGFASDCTVHIVGVLRLLSTAPPPCK